MGKIFELIEDSALEKSNEHYEECHVCNKTDVDIYQYQGECQLENGEIDNDIHAACSECILTKKLSHVCDFEYIKTINNYVLKTDLPIKEQEQLKDKLIKKYQRTPDIPIFAQNHDRPLCCNDITEFIGYPKDEPDLYERMKNFIYWEGKIETNRYNFEGYESFESEGYGNFGFLHEVATFNCSHCDKKYFTYQFT